MLAVSSLTLLKSLDLGWCKKVTEEGLRAIINLPALTELSLRYCGDGVTDEGMRAVSMLTALTSLRLHECWTITAEGLRAVIK